jgi:hypothetical protein
MSVSPEQKRGVPFRVTVCSFTFHGRASIGKKIQHIAGKIGS